MSNNFLEIEPAKDPSNKRRNIFSIILIISFIIFGIVYKSGKFDLDKKFARFAQVTTPANLEAINDVRAQSGGDVTINPPEEIKPQIELIGDLPAENLFSANSILIKDVDTSKVLFAKNEYEQYPIASITKLMSALVLLEKDLNWEQEVPVVGADSLDTHVYAGEVYTMDDLWHAALIASSNKAVLSMAEAIDWPVEAFVERMNQKALELGMSNTHFTDPTGLDVTDVSTASDISILLNEALHQDKIKETLTLKEYKILALNKKKNHHMWNTNWLLIGWITNDFAEIKGGKTGYIPQSGYNFVMQVSNGTNDLNVVVLGTESHEARFTEARDIANAVFESYKWPDETEEL